MRAVSLLKLFLLAIGLSTGLTAVASAQDAPAAAPVGSADLQACLQETGDYAVHGRTVDYLIGITNTCEKRLRCEIFANVTGVRGTTLGHTVMILGTASSGAGAKKTYAMRVKAAGGVVQVSRECKVL